jgi:hypothetical protein
MVEQENWIGTEVETGTKDWYDPNNFVHEPDDEVCLEKFWTGLSKIREQLSEATKLLQRYYDLIS